MAHWLLKTEPDVFSFDDLMRAPNRTSGWDGVRNYQARNMLRDEIQVGDGVLFYHSSADPPGVAGTAQVMRAGYPDGSILTVSGTLAGLAGVEKIVEVNGRHFDLRAEGYAVLYPQQAVSAHPHRCWKWYDRATQQGGTQ